MILFISILIGALSGAIVLLAIRFTEVKSTAAYNLENWERAAYLHNEERDLRYDFARKAHEENKRAEAALAKLRKYGLEDL